MSSGELKRAHPVRLFEFPWGSLGHQITIWLTPGPAVDTLCTVIW